MSHRAVMQEMPRRSRMTAGGAACLFVAAFLVGVLVWGAVA